MKDILVRYWESPCGEMVLGAFGDRLCMCDWVRTRHPGRVRKRLSAYLDAGFSETPSEVTQEAVRQLGEYFAGKRQKFDIPVLLAGTDFQKTVWERLMEIPYGQSLTYGGLAGALGRPEAVRAVAAACGANAFSIIVPCHRVTGSDGSLTGYAGGIEAKRFLLGLESGAKEIFSEIP